MPLLQKVDSPQHEAELLRRCRSLEGLSLLQLGILINTPPPVNPLQRKGWVGQALEFVLGASAGNHATPDFPHLGIELKTIPINHLGKPAQSTFVTSISLLTIHKETWQSSQCFSKLKRVLWVPVEADQHIPFSHRRIGRAILWSPSTQEEAILCADWSELSLMIGTGRLAEIDAKQGQFLQVRPKAANTKALCYGFDEHGNKIQTLPRGFYLRSCFTERVLS